MIAHYCKVKQLHHCPISILFPRKHLSRLPDELPRSRLHFGRNSRIAVNSSEPDRIIENPKQQGLQSLHQLHHDVDTTGRQWQRLNQLWQRDEERKGEHLDQKHTGCSKEGLLLFFSKLVDLRGNWSCAVWNVVHRGNSWSPDRILRLHLCMHSLQLRYSNLSEAKYCLAGRKIATSRTCSLSLSLL